MMETDTTEITAEPVVRKERPILFSGSMVRAILNGTKTVTRRKVKGLALDWLKDFTPEFIADEGNRFSPYGYAGDTLWVRETYTQNGLAYYRYKADYDDPKSALFTTPSVPEKFRGKWKPGIHMPRAACRLFLVVTSVRIEKLGSITPEQAIAEGIQSYKYASGVVRYRDYMADASGYGHPDHDYPTVSDPVQSFRTLWESINGPWDPETWVWVIEFEKTEKP